MQPQAGPGENPSDLGEWRAVRPHQAARWFSSVNIPWWIAGGWALDLFLGRETRPHQDLDVGLLRRNVLDMLRLLPAWEFFEAQNGVLTRLGVGDAPALDVHSLWGRPVGTDLWMLELLLDESEDDDWVFRRQPAIRRAHGTIVRRSPEQIPYLAPEIQLLYKAKCPRLRDRADFGRTAPSLDSASRAWLLDALVWLDPEHEWIPAIAPPLSPGRSNPEPACGSCRPASTSGTAPRRGCG